MPESKTVILCADDYAIDERTCAGILLLAQEGRLSAVSCFSESPLWQREGPKLLPFLDRIALGLHFNLTEPFGLEARPLAYWMAAAVAGRIDAGAIRDSLQRQLEQFRAIAGREPSFIDGHQHVHAFPRIRDVVNDVVRALPGGRSPPVRDVSSFFGPTDAPLKRFIIRLFARIGRGEAEQSVTYFNSAMSGDYSLRSTADYPGLFAQWLADAPERGLIMCHPALEEVGNGGSVGSAGARELAFLRSVVCGELLDRHGIRLGA
jgi:predicted glycoside hydrolase/deacetylase ChbG (UPF0249 family)